jgi:hypothetical protein
MIELTVLPAGPGRFEARLDNRVLAKSRTPFCDAARQLLDLGYDRDDVVTMRHAGSGTVALRAKVGVAARLTVSEEPRPAFRRHVEWMTSPSAAGASPVRFPEQGVGYQPCMITTILRGSCSDFSTPFAPVPVLAPNGGGAVPGAVADRRAA